MSDAAVAGAVVSDQFDRVSAAWDRAAAGRPPMEQRIWSEICAATVDGDSRLHIVVAGDGAEAAVAPLVVRPPGHALELIGARRLGEPMDIPASDDGALEDALEQVRALRRPLRLARLPRASPAVEAVRRAFGRQRVVVREAAPAPFIELDDGWAEPERMLSSRRRSDLRRARRRAEATGDVRVDLFAPSPAEVPALFEEVVRIEAASWKGRERTALYFDHQLRAFFERYTLDAAERGTLRVAILRIGDQAAAVQLGVEELERYWTLKIGYDESFARASPGMLLLLETIGDAARRGLQAFELLGRAEAWTRVWTERLHEYVDVHAYERSTRSALQLASDARVAARRIRHDEDLSLRAAAATAARTVVARAGRAYVAGVEPDDLAVVARSFQDRGLSITGAYWNDQKEPPADVAAAYEATCGVLARPGLDAWVAFKAPALGFAQDLLDRSFTAAESAGTPVVFDALGPADADATLALVTEWAPRRTVPVRMALPARWARSAGDAEHLAGPGIGVRIVKGQFADQQDREVDMRRGFMAIVETLVGSASPVAIATHDVPLLEQALARLSAGPSTVEVELLFGLPLAGPLAAARAAGVPVRIYVPYGVGWAPYALRHVARRPKTLWWLARDTVRARRLTGRP